MTRFLSISLLVFMVSAFGPVGQGEAKKQEPRQLPLATFQPGEAFTWNVSLRGIVGATAQMAVGKTDKSGLITIHSKLETAGIARFFKYVRDSVTSTIDPKSGVPKFSRSDVIFGDKAFLVETLFKTNTCEIEFQRRGKKKQRRIQKMPKGLMLFDFHSSIAALRNWDGKKGEKTYLYTISGRRLWHTRLISRGVETIKTPLGSFKTIRVDGTSKRLYNNRKVDKRKKPRTFSIWRSADEFKLPLLVVAKTEYGDVRVALSSYEQR